MGQNDRRESGLVAWAISIGLHIVILLLFAGSGLFAPEPKPDEAAEGNETEDRVVEPAKETDKPGGPPETVTPPPVPAPRAPAQPSRTVAVPRAPAPPPAPTAFVSPAPSPAAPAAATVESYIVKAGDNLTRIAASVGCTVTEIAKLNGKTVKKMADLKVGQKIKLPKKQQ